MIYEMRAEGAKIAVITNKLNAEGIPSPGKLRYLRGYTTDEKITRDEFKAFSEEHRKTYFELTEKKMNSLK